MYASLPLLHVKKLKAAEEMSRRVEEGQSVPTSSEQKSTLSGSQASMSFQSKSEGQSCHVECESCSSLPVLEPSQSTFPHIPIGISVASEGTPRPQHQHESTQSLMMPAKRRHLSCGSYDTISMENDVYTSSSSALVHSQAMIQSQVHKSSPPHLHPCLPFDSTLNTKNLVNATHKFSKWYELGIQLNIDKDNLDIISRNFPRDVQRCKIELYDTWLKSDEEPSWLKVIEALKLLSYGQLANMISSKYCRGTPEQPAPQSGACNDIIKSKDDSVACLDLSVTTDNATALDNIEDIIEGLDDLFRSMITNLREKIRQNEIEITKFLDIIKEKLPQRLLGLKDHIEYKYIEDKKVSEFFRKLDDIWNFLDYDLLRFIIRRCGDKELKTKMEDYHKRMKDFCENTTIYDLIKNWKPKFAKEQIPEEYKICITKLAWNPSDHKVKELQSNQLMMRKAIPQELAIAAFVMCSVEHSSVLVRWLVWIDLVPQAINSIKNLVKEDPEWLFENSFLSIIMDNVVLYFKPPDNGTSLEQHCTSTNSRRPHYHRSGSLEEVLQLRHYRKAKMSKEIPKRMEKLSRAARIDSNGEIYFTRTSSTTSIDSGKSLHHSSSSLECSLQLKHENMGLSFLDIPVEAPLQEPQLACPIQEGCAAVGGALQEGVVLQDLNPANLFTDKDDDNDDIDRDTSLVPTLPLPEPALVPVQPSDACSESGKAKQTQVKTDGRDFLPLIPQNAIEETTACLEENREDAKQKMIVPKLPAMYCVRTVPVTTAHLKHIESTMIVITIQRIHTYLENHQSMFESKKFNIFKTEQLKYRGKIVILITSSKILSIGFSLVKGENDKQLPWPFNMMVLFKLTNIDDRQSRIRGFRSDINGSKFPECLSRPSICNTAIGFPNFAPATSLLSNGFIENDSLRVIARITSKNYVPYSDVKLELPAIVKA